MKKYKDYYVTIGLEIHIALQTKEKLFSSTLNGFEKVELDVFDAGLPGVLPVISREPVEMAVAFGLAVGSEIRKFSVFERKHYFYPDLPMGYQITQQHQPILVGGVVKIKDELGETCDVQIEHAHLECDAAKSRHEMYSSYTAIDLARCASPLLEVVSTPCLHSAQEAKAYAKKVYSMAVFMGICDGKIEEGSFRVDASISLSKEKDVLGTRVEVKNISSFGFLESALLFEMRRQAEVLDDSMSVVMETRLFDEKTITTQSMRTKETVAEYRYMPDPDIEPLQFDDLFIDGVKELYDVKYFKYQDALSDMFALYDLKYDEAMFPVYFGGKAKYVWKSLIGGIIVPSEISIKILGFWLSDQLFKDTSAKGFTPKDLKVLVDSSLGSAEIKQGVKKWLLSDVELSECLPVVMSEEKLIELIARIRVEYQSQFLKAKDEPKILQFIIGKVLAAGKGAASAIEVKRILVDLMNIK